MLRIALNQPRRRGLGDFEDAWTGQTVEDSVTANLIAEGLDPSYSGMPESAFAPSAPVSPSLWDNIVSAFTAKPVVNAALNKYMFGSSTPIPTATNVPRPPVSGQWIAGVPNSYVAIGAAAVALLVMSKKR
jgi:hypothetical protein